jgi:gas vesicle protein
MYDNYRQKDFFWGALVGGTVAALTTLLFTTKKGKEIQKHIENAYGEVEDAVTSKLSETKEKLEDTADHVHKKMTAAAKAHDDHPRSKHEEVSKSSK